MRIADSLPVFSKFYLLLFLLSLKYIIAFHKSAATHEVHGTDSFKETAT